MFGAITFLPVYLQLARGDTPTQSGLAMLPLTAGILASSAISGYYIRKTGRYKILPIAGLMFRQIGASLAIALFGAIFTARVSAATAETGAAGAPMGAAAGQGLRMSPETLATLPPPIQQLIGQAITTGLAPIFWLSAGFAAIGFLVALMLEEIPLAGKSPDQANSKKRP